MMTHHDDHSFVPGTRQTGKYRPIGFMVGSYEKPTLTEQGIDVDGLIAENRALIEDLRKGRH